MEIVFKNILQLVLDEMEEIYKYSGCDIWIMYNNFEDFADGRVDLYIDVDDLDLHTTSTHTLSFDYCDLGDLNYIHKRLFEYIRNLYDKAA